MRGTLDRNTYVFHLSQLFHIHRTVEQIAEKTEQLHGYFHPWMMRTSAIERDLTKLTQSVGPEQPITEAVQICETLGQICRTMPLAMIGPIYVLEGSRMGSLVLAKPLAGCLGISGEPGTGIDYHKEHAELVPMRLKSWKAEIDAIGFSPQDQQNVIDAASDFMRRLLKLYAAIEPAAKSDLHVA
jgi:heme oxygenase